MKRFLARLAAGLGSVCMMLACGCATTPEEPTLEAGLANLRFSQATLFETVAVLDIRLENLAPEEVRVTGASHRVAVNGVKLGRGMTGETLTVPRLGSALQPVEFHLRNLSVARTLHELSRSRTIDYELESTLYVQRAGGSERAIRVRRSGRLDLPTGSVPEAGR